MFEFPIPEMLLFAFDSALKFDMPAPDEGITDYAEFYLING